MNKYFLLLYTVLAIFIFPNCQAGNFADDPLNIPQWDGGTEAGNPPPAAVGDQPVNTRRNRDGICPEAQKNPETGLCEFIEPSIQVFLPHGPLTRDPQLNQTDIRPHAEAISPLHLSDRYQNLPLVDQEDEECVVCPIEDLPDAFDETFEEESEEEYEEDHEESEWLEDSQLEANAIRAVTPPIMIMKKCCAEDEE